jgi:hypothetical protein
MAASAMAVRIRLSRAERWTELGDGAAAAAEGFEEPGRGSGAST